MIFNIQNIHSSVEELYFKDGGVFSREGNTSVLLVDSGKNYSIKAFSGRDYRFILIQSSGPGSNTITISSKGSDKSIVLFCIGGSFQHSMKKKTYYLSDSDISIIPNNNCQDQKLLPLGRGNNILGFFEFQRNIFDEGETTATMELSNEIRENIFSEVSGWIPFNDHHLLNHYFLTRDFYSRYRSFFKKFAGEWVMKVVNFKSVDQEKVQPEFQKQSILYRDYDFSQLEKTVELLESNLKNPPPIKKISRLVGINDFKLKYAFKQVYGETINSFVRKKRMEWAKKLIEKNPHASIFDIAEQIGYANKGHFAQRFKEVAGLLPKDFQKKIRNEKQVV